MSRERMQEVAVVGLDLAKNVFQVHGWPLPAASCSENSCGAGKC